MHWTTVFENNYQQFVKFGWLRGHDLRVMRGSMDKIYKFIMERTPVNVEKSTIKSGICALKIEILHKLEAAKSRVVVRPVGAPTTPKVSAETPNQATATPETFAELLNPITSSIKGAFDRLTTIIAEKDEQLKTKNNKIVELETQLIDSMNTNSTIAVSRAAISEVLKNVERLSIDINKTVANMELNNERAIE